MNDKNGEYIAIKTAGFPGTQADIIRAVQSQNVFMLHVVDAIEMINISHNPDGKAMSSRRLFLGISGLRGLRPLLCQILF